MPKIKRIVPMLVLAAMLSANARTRVRRTETVIQTVVVEKSVQETVIQTVVVEKEVEVAGETGPDGHRREGSGCR